ncbi:hypothetical protein OIU76_020165 [Salix suchowensis]|uniref:Uncharacterized protein n=2 Tax=Salix TaxID=40685 RepID=A0AAD6KLF3_9ROSI|nr:Magnesium transporter [Salix suchowensis]KAJ6299137.1 hypothetical protein OIU76_020165 [Salix suchowensis]KAJ6302613.1 hypothetical protein OIU77_016661 [Salix suchowensis]KAJ6315229.1 hypothetical protein OIU78_018670 [Salix suchowensis]KAJ6424447.1 hypothetical protein OIU84_025268 [Salix udensis]
MSSSISQSVMMALTVTVNKFASSNVHAVHKKDSKRTAKAATMAADIGRRGVLLSTVVGVYSVNDSKTELLKRYLKKSEDNRAKNDKERMDSYYKRNYKDYFDFVEGSLRGKNEQDLTESEKGILDWLQKNK